MRAMELQQQRHIKEVFMDSALKPLASDPGSDSVSNFSFKSAHTQSIKAEKRNAQAEYYDLSGTDMEPPFDLDEDSSPSSDGQNDRRNHTHIEDYFNSIMDIKNESMLREMESERRMQEINGN